MSSLECDCDSAGIANTGVASCVPKFGVTKALIFQPLYASDGTRNYLDRTVTMDAAYINALINNADRSKAIYPVGYDIKNVAKNKSESTKQTYDDGSIYPISAGVYGFTAIYPEAGPVFSGIMNSIHCTEVGIYEVNAAGSVRGYNDAENGDKIYPSPLSKATIEAIWNDQSDTVLENTVLNFQFDPNFKAEYLEIIPNAEFVGINMLGLRGLVDVSSTNVSCIAGGLTTIWVVKLRTVWNTPMKGLLVGDFAAYNTTDSASKTISSSVESPSGIYTLTISTLETVSDKLRLTPTKTGFDFTKVIANLATVA